MPFPVTKEVLERGRERYNIFCAPCHSRVGDGNGFVPSRGFARKPPSFHIVRLQKAPLGYFYDVMTEGFGIMPDYASQIPPRDRWNIVAYVRALQLSQNATMADVPAGQKIPSEPPKFSDSGTGATLPVPAPETKSGRNEGRREMSAVPTVKLDLTAPPVVKTIAQRLLIVGGVFALVSLWFAISHPDEFYSAYLVGFMDWLGVALGSMAIIMIRHLTGGGWGVVIRRLQGAAMRTLPLLTVLFVPIMIAVWQGRMYPWAMPLEKISEPHIREHLEITSSSWPAT